MEEGFNASTVVRNETWEHELVRKESPDLSESQRAQLVMTLMGIRTGNKLPWGAQTKLAREVGVHKSTICKLFRKAQEANERGEPIDVSTKRKGKCGRKPYYDNNDDWLESCPLHLRGTVRAYAGYLKCSHMHIWRLIKKGVLRAHTSANHPDVSEQNKLQRMDWVLSHIKPATETEKAKFVDMKHTIHIDEKWFYLNPGTRKFYMLPKEVDPYRSTKSRNYSIKVMFMAATSRPLYDDDGKMFFDGKFGIWPFVVREAAKKKKTSKNRPAGTVETKVIKNINQEVTREMLINKVLPCIREKWPACMGKELIIQQDNARPHISDNDPLFREAATQDGFNMRLMFQPPQSPDFNVLDLGLFRALQSLQYQSFPVDIDDLVVKVEETYARFDPTLIRFAWITLQYVMIEALKDRGGNNYKIPHIGKVRLERLGLLVDELEVEQEIFDEATNYLANIRDSGQASMQQLNAEAGTQTQGTQDHTNMDAENVDDDEHTPMELENQYIEDLTVGGTESQYIEDLTTSTEARLNQHVDMEMGTQDHNLGSN